MTVSLQQSILVDRTVDEWPEQLAPPLERFLAYWRSKVRPERKVPLRRDVDPVEIKELLPSLVLIKSHPDATHGTAYRWRLAGSEFRLRYGVELTGRWFHEVLPPEIMAEIEPLLKAIFAAEQPHFQRGRSRWQDRPYVAFERIVAPLSSTGDACDMLIGYWHWIPVNHPSLLN